VVLRVRVLQSTKINYLGLNHLAPGNNYKTQHFIIAIDALYYSAEILASDADSDITAY